MRLPSDIHEKREHGDNVQIVEMFGIRKSAISDAFSKGDASPKIIKAIIDFYNIKYGKPEVFNLTKKQ